MIIFINRFVFVRLDELLETTFGLQVEHVAGNLPSTNPILNNTSELQALYQHLGFVGASDLVPQYVLKTIDDSSQSLDNAHRLEWNAGNQTPESNRQSGHDNRNDQINQSDMDCSVIPSPYPQTGFYTNDSDINDQGFHSGNSEISMLLSTRSNSGFSSPILDLNPSPSNDSAFSDLVDNGIFYHSPKEQDIVTSKPSQESQSYSQQQDNVKTPLRGNIAQRLNLNDLAWDLLDACNQQQQAQITAFEEKTSASISLRASTSHAADLIQNVLSHQSLPTIVSQQAKQTMLISESAPSASSCIPTAVCTCPQGPPPSSMGLHPLILEAILRKKVTPGPLLLGVPMATEEEIATFTQRNKNDINRVDDNVCANCHVADTCLWRQVDENTTLCNACGLYYVCFYDYGTV